MALVSVQSMDDPVNCRLANETMAEREREGEGERGREKVKNEKRKIIQVLFLTILKSLTKQAIFNIILSYTHVHVNSSFISIGSMNIP